MRVSLAKRMLSLFLAPAKSKKTKGLLGASTYTRVRVDPIASTGFRSTAIRGQMGDDGKEDDGIKHPWMHQLPDELVDAILNGSGGSYDPRAPFLDARWRFAARGVCRRWKRIVDRVSKADRVSIMRANPHFAVDRSAAIALAQGRLVACSAMAALIRYATHGFRCMDASSARADADLLFRQVHHCVDRDGPLNVPDHQGANPSERQTVGRLPFSLVPSFTVGSLFAWRKRDA